MSSAQLPHPPSIQVEAEIYASASYDTLERFISYWHQINEIRRSKAACSLEVGIGNGFVSDFLKGRGFNHFTVDIDPALKPDFVASLPVLPFEDDQFDTVACFEVLEHLPWDRFEPAVREMARIARKRLLISLPDCRRSYRILIPIPKVGKLDWSCTVPFVNPPEQIFRGQHYWEIGKKGYPLSRVMSELERSQFFLVRHFRVKENPYHHFFELAPSKEFIDN